MVKRALLSTGLFFLVVFVFFASCTAVDNTLGQDFIPDQQQSALKIDTISGGINAYLAQYPFITSDLEYGYMGTRQSDEFGTVRAGFATQFAWINASHMSGSDVVFGTAPKADSLVLYIYFESYGGMAEVERTYNIYLLKERFLKDETYYSDHDITPAIDPGDIFASFSYKGSDYSGTDSVKVYLTGPKAEAFMNELLDDSESIYENDEQFIDKFNGFYFAPADDAPARSSVLSMDLVNSSMAFHYHNYTSADQATVKDTLHILYSFSNHSESPITSFSTFKYDYAGTDIQNINDTLTTDVAVSKGYVQTLGGVSTYLRITPEFIEDLKSKIVAPYTKIAINRAEITIPLVDPTVNNLNTANLRLGMYDNYTDLIGISDYDYYMESYYGMTLQYDGYLSRSRKVYVVNISSYLQQMINYLNYQDADETDFRIILAPAADEVYGFRQVELRTKADNPLTEKDPLRVAITYTLLK